MTSQTELAPPAARCCFPAGGVLADAADRGKKKKKDVKQRKESVKVKVGKKGNVKCVTHVHLTQYCTVLLYGRD